MKRFSSDKCLSVAAIIVAILFALPLLLTTAYADDGAAYIITAEPYANVRESADKKSTDLGDLNCGEIVTGHDYCDGWIMVDVSFELSQGWVRADLLTLVDYTVGRYTNTSGGRANIRQQPDPDGDHVAWLKADRSTDVIRWVDMNGVPWAYTSKGYISGEYLEEDSE